MQNEKPFDGLLGEWINLDNYMNNCIYVCSCGIIWSSNNASFNYTEKCPNSKCKCDITKYIWYTNNDLSDDIINNKVFNDDISMCAINFFPNNQNNGIWIKATKYKSFGIFECKHCKYKKKSKQWQSAYANSKYIQECIKCKMKVYPKFMWINHTLHKSNNKETNKPHLSHLCEACKHNDCLYKFKVNNLL